jgi:uncharacterized cupin superfamily protein
MEMIIQKMVGVGKGKRQPENWKQNIRKRKRTTGSKYIGLKKFVLSFSEYVFVHLNLQLPLQSF